MDGLPLRGYSFFWVSFYYDDQMFYDCSVFIWHTWSIEKYVDDHCGWIAIAWIFVQSFDALNT